MMRNIKLILFLLLLALSNSSLLAQKIAVKGQALAFNTVPIVNANVKIAGVEEAVKTDWDGRFTCMCHDKDKLVITAAGFDKLTIKVKKKKANRLVAKMKLLKSSGAPKLAVLKGHILAVDEFIKLVKERSDINDYSRYRSILDIIRKEFPSLKIVDGEVIIRGKSSLTGSSAARFQIDGVWIDQSTAESISTSDIASIKVLKGGSAAIYGVRGGNGIISIKTKMGKSE